MHGRHRYAVVIMGLAALSVVGCREKNQFAAPPPSNVTVAQPLYQDVVTFREFTGRTAPVASVEVRARVSGFLASIEFREGTFVKAGDPLFTIEAEEYEATLLAANARKLETEAEVTRAQADFSRIEALYKQQTAAEMEYVNAEAALETAKAAVMAAEAEVAQAELNLSYTKIAAPIAGRINRSRVDVGNLVGKSEPTLLTTIVPWDPIHVYVTVNERDVLEFRRRRVGMSEEPADIKLFLRLADGTDYPWPGAVDYVENRVDPETGTLRGRGVFPNPDYLLVPGIFARVLVPNDSAKRLLVPEAALQRDMTGYYLLVVGGDETVDRRDVEVGARAGSYREVLSGLEESERVIVKGLQRARPGVKVQAETIELPPYVATTRPATEDTTTQPAGENG